jgi:hypothetical protein
MKGGIPGRNNCTWSAWLCLIAVSQIGMLMPSPSNNIGLCLDASAAPDKTAITQQAGSEAADPGSRLRAELS